MRISEESIRRIKDAAVIEEVVGDFVSLKRKGQNLWACCPFHNEKSPSFSVSPAKNIYKCFGCGAAGDSVKFVMDIEGLSYPEALRYLAEKFNIHIEEAAPDANYEAQRNLRESLFLVLNYAKKHYQHLLSNHREGQSIGLSYFKERGFSEATIAAFELGYSLNDWHDLEQSALSKGYSLEMLEKAGLTIRKDEDGKNRHYDRFRGRVMFPVHDLAGKVLAFGARALKSEEKPKYLNSPETEVYLKSEVLYGIFQAKQAIRQHDNCYLTEGYTDVISMHQAGIANVVASSGTSLTEGQIRLIRRFTENITVLYDGDPAGIKASVRGIDMILEQGLNVRAVMFPTGEDPDSYIRKNGGAAFKTYLESRSQDFIDFKASLFLQDAGNDPVKLARVVREMVNSIAKIPDAIKRELYVRQCSQLMQIAEDTLTAEVNKILLENYRKTKEQGESKPASSTRTQVQYSTRKQTSAPPDMDVPMPTEEPAGYSDEHPYELTTLPDDVLPSLWNQEIAQLVNVHEQECLRLLLRFGDRLVDQGVFLWQYLLSEIDDIEFHTPLYKAILQRYKTFIDEGTVPDADLMIREGSPEMVALMVNLTLDKWQVSENWEKKHEISIPKEDDRLPVAAYENILRLKKTFVESLENQLMQQIAEAERTEDQEMLQALMAAYMELIQQRVRLSQPLGNVVSRRQGK